MNRFYIPFLTAFLTSSLLVFGEPKYNANTIKSVIDEWMIKAKASPQQLTQDQMPDLIARSIIEKIPDTQLRLEAVIDYAAFGGNAAPFTARMVWKKIASDEVRAAFLNNALQAGTSETIGYISTFTADDLVDVQTVLKNPDLAGATALEREIVYSGKSFMPLFQSSEGVSSRLLAIWFSNAPYLAALTSLYSSDGKIIEKIRRINDLRHEIDKGQSRDQKESSWRKLDQELQTLFLSVSPVLEMYAAGVLKWRRTVEASFSESDALITAIKQCNNPVVSCILQGITTETLTSLTSEKIILASTPNPTVAPTAIAAIKTPVPPVTAPSQKQAPSPSPTVAETKSTPWPWIVGAILLLAVAGGILLKLLRK